MWRERTGDKNFEVETYGGHDVLKERIGKDSDSPRCVVSRPLSEVQPACSEEASRAPQLMVR